MREGMSIILVSVIISSFNADIIHSQPGSQESNAVGLKVGVTVNSTKTPVADGAEIRQSNLNYNAFGNHGSSNGRRCPLCDSSVFPYCSEKLFHDACCCTDPYQFPLPYKCQYADCAFLHANSCREHRLISNCCCSDEYRSLPRGLGKSVDVRVINEIEEERQNNNNNNNNDDNKQLAKVISAEQRSLQLLLTQIMTAGMRV